MATDWGLGGLATFVQTSHAEVYPAIDPTSVKLPQPSIVCVVGASRGIGAGIARAYAKASATGLVLASRRTSGLEATAASCKQFNPNVEVEIVECDITSASSVPELAKRIKVRFGRLDVVAINSGVSGPVVTKLTDTDPLTFEQAIHVNYTGLFLCAKFLLPVLLETQGGAKNFITVSSFAALIIRGPFANAQYCVSKLAQLKMMEHMHEQYHDEGLLSWSVHPGSVDSELTAVTPKPFKAYLTDSPELCGGFCTWLSSAGREKAWLCGRLVNAKYDVLELEAKKDEILKKDLLKLKICE
jgi:NAD(P)-dependent dehydrogenase (short-subunit alcohol dehydrogenase family)